MSNAFARGDWGELPAEVRKMLKKQEPGETITFMVKNDNGSIGRYVLFKERRKPSRAELEAGHQAAATAKKRKRPGFKLFDDIIEDVMKPKSKKRA
jgi:hypothetical protein